MMGWAPLLAGSRRYSPASSSRRGSRVLVPSVPALTRPSWPWIATLPTCVPRALRLQRCLLRNSGLLILLGPPAGVFSGRAPTRPRAQRPVRPSLPLPLGSGTPGGELVHQPLCPRVCSQPPTRPSPLAPSPLLPRRHPPLAILTQTDIGLMRTSHTHLLRLRHRHVLRRDFHHLHEHPSRLGNANQPLTPPPPPPNERIPPQLHLPPLRSRHLHLPHPIVLPNRKWTHRM